MHDIRPPAMGRLPLDGQIEPVISQEPEMNISNAEGAAGELRLLLQRTVFSQATVPRSMTYGSSPFRGVRTRLKNNACCSAGHQNTF
ncbi:hypothetical protein BG74_05035 [Sodalis-like endosymbiont of Proechinophthirus fluctus]|uniref:hypothetical protein n=1 Tax=Sodalis-like endosymbiont of Proechinophthirus fluctus TaxID=1462730 RepID=UPI0007A8BDA7|nr:hypothetical protein [Sodalis-like endosymbiont of Proechinophthirus fluctus]KYP97171.1 hypothetical protein BG74_05035 [Sodalis-like endosymbiont of Proechinophthirus fluctus]